MKFFTLHADVSLTRRKRYHLVTDPAGQVVWSARLLSEAFAFFEERAITEFLVQSGGQSYRVAASPAQPPQET